MRESNAKVDAVKYNSLFTVPREPQKAVQAVSPLMLEIPFSLSFFFCRVLETSNLNRLPQSNKK